LKKPRLPQVWEDAKSTVALFSPRRSCIVSIIWPISMHHEALSNWGDLSFKDIDVEVERLSQSISKLKYHTIYM
jgi:hypothetical protein